MTYQTILLKKLGKITRKIDRVFLHCSASDNPKHDNVATMRKWHLQRGWSDVGYHIFIRKDGMAEFGRDLNKTPAAQAGNNKGTIAICLHGLKKELFTKEQFTSLNIVCGLINAKMSEEVTFHGHSEVAAKACPVFDYKKVLGIDRYGTLNGIDKNINITIENNKPILKKGSRGAEVIRLQELLNIKVDGIFGPNTLRAVKKFQKDKGLIVDGIVGKNTLKALEV